MKKVYTEADFQIGKTYKIKVLKSGWFSANVGNVVYVTINSPHDCSYYATDWPDSTPIKVTDGLRQLVIRFNDRIAELVEKEVQESVKTKKSRYRTKEQIEKDIELIREEKQTLYTKYIENSVAADGRITQLKNELKKLSGPTWFSKDGREVFISQMSDAHLLNCISVCLKQDPRYFSDAVAGTKRMAVLPNMVIEADKRGLKVEV